MRGDGRERKTKHAREPEGGQRQITRCRGATRGKFHLDRDLGHARVEDFGVDDVRAEGLDMKPERRDDVGEALVAGIPLADDDSPESDGIRDEPVGVQTHNLSAQVIVQ